MTLFVALLAIHIASEFYLAPTLNEQKSRLPIVLAVLAVASFSALSFSGFSLLLALSASTTIALQYGVLHAFIAPLASTLMGLLFKQILHAFFIGVVVWLWAGTEARINGLAMISAIDVERILSWGLAYLLAIKPSSVAISLLLNNWTTELAATESASSNRPLAEAGTYIGYFERALIVTFVLLGQLPGVALVLAAKSVFRFGDLKDHSSRMFTEYVMLGTFASALAGIMSGLLGVYLGEL